MLKLTKYRVELCHSQLEFSFGVTLTPKELLDIGLMRCNIYTRKLTHSECADLVKRCPKLMAEVEKVAIPFSLIKWDLVVKQI